MLSSPDSLDPRTGAVNGPWPCGPYQLRTGPFVHEGGRSARHARQFSRGRVVGAGWRRYREILVRHARDQRLQRFDLLELFGYIHPDAIEAEPTRPNEIGMHRATWATIRADRAMEPHVERRAEAYRGQSDLRFGHSPRSLQVKRVPPAGFEPAPPF
jgi:hypothetical protein